MSVSRELVEAIKIITDREKNGESVPENWEEWTEAELNYLAANPAGMVYVNVYRLSREYGGPEEGSWYFDAGSVELSIVCDSRESAKERAEMLREIYTDNGNRYSVVYYRKSPDFAVEIDDKPAADWPRHFPTYE